MLEVKKHFRRVDEIRSSTSYSSRKFQSSDELNAVGAYSKRHDDLAVV